MLQGTFGAGLMKIKKYERICDAKQIKEMQGWRGALASLTTNHKPKSATKWEL